MNTKRNNVEKLDNIISKIHDCWFGIDMIEYEKQKKILKIPLGQSAKGPFDSCLKISSVNKLQIKDTEKIEYYDINQVKIDHKKNVVKIICNIPLSFSVEVGPNYNITLEQQVK